MAYMNQEKKQQIATALKSVMPKSWKYSLSVLHHSTIVLTIQSAPVDFFSEYRGKNDLGERTYMDVNPYWMEDCWSDKTLETFKKIKDVLNLNNHDRSDIQTDYFDVGHYISIHVGRYDKPFVCTARQTA